MQYSLIPLRLQYMRIAPEAVNVNASFQNASVIGLVKPSCGRRRKPYRACVFWRVIE